MSKLKAITPIAHNDESLDQHVSIAMITMNEAAAVAAVIQSIKQVMPDAEMIIVDSSHDETPAIAKAAGAKVIRQFPPCGYGPAMARALHEASREIIITMDCDNTYPADELPTLARLMLIEGYDLVDASRLKGKPAAMPWLNYVGNVAFAWFASVLFLRRFTDLHSGMRAYRKSMLDALLFETEGAALPVELLLKPIRCGYRVSTVFIAYHERMGESKMQAWQSAWWTLKRILNVRFGRHGRVILQPSQSEKHG